MTRHFFVLWSPSAVCFFVNGAIYGTWATQVPIAKERLAVSDAHFGLLLLAMGLGAIGAMIASGSRALVGDLKLQMSEAEFNTALANTVDEIYRASTLKV
jgi:hypothetical protein